MIISNTTKSNIKRYKMITRKGRTVVYQEGTNNVKFMGTGSEGVIEALRYLEYLRFINRVNRTYLSTPIERMHRVDRLWPCNLEKTLEHIVDELTEEEVFAHA